MVQTISSAIIPQPYQATAFEHSGGLSTGNTSQNLGSQGNTNTQYAAGQNGAGGIAGSNNVPGASNLIQGAQQKLKASAMNLLKHIVQEDEAHLPKDKKTDILNTAGFNKTQIEDLLAEENPDALDKKIGKAIEKIAAKSPEELQEVLQNLNNRLASKMAELKTILPPNLQDLGKKLEEDLQGGNLDDAQRALDGMKNQINGSSDSVINNLNMGVMMNEMSAMVEITKKMLELAGKSQGAIGAGIA